MEAAVVYVLSKVEELAKQANGEGSHWLEELSPLVIKLKSCAEVTAAKAKASLTLITLEVRTCFINNRQMVSMFSLSLSWIRLW